MVMVLLQVATHKRCIVSDKKKKEKLGQEKLLNRNFLNKKKKGTS